tara:strand:+ start:281 stop:1255 length:975 start_codon:yes stop_codon:yes gene_type:complete
MAYLPKSKINIKEATPSNGDSKFVIISSNKPYVGPYIETSDGKYFIGTNFTNKGEELIIPQLTNLNFGNNKDFKSYNKIKKDPYNFLAKIKPIPSYKNIPTEKDHERGYYNRYFSSRVNQQFGYQEISLKTYKSINSQSSKYDHYLHDVGVIKWALNGNVHSINQSNLITLERTFPFLSNLFPILNEFHRPNLQVQTNLYTEGDELYYKDGTEYIGDYHIHPTQGPMVGATHVKSAHPKLYYSDQLPLSADRMDPTDKEFEIYRNKERKRKLLENKQSQIKEAPASRGSTSTSSGGGASTSSGRVSSTSGGGGASTSSGGGGGY